MSAEQTPSRRGNALTSPITLTEGQTYTVVILLLVAALLTSSLTGLTGRIASVAAIPPLPRATSSTPAPPDTGLDTPAVTSTPRQSLSTTPQLAVPDPTTTTTTTPSFPPASPFEPYEPDPPPVPEPCTSEPLIAASRDALTALDALTGGVVPDATMVSALALATGCSETDPAIFLVAALIEIGQGVPDLGLDIVELPVLPFLALPDPVIELVQPFRAVVDPICGTVSTLAIVTSIAGPAYPPPFDAAFRVSLFYALATCGQLQA